MENILFSNYWEDRQGNEEYMKDFKYYVLDEEDIEEGSEEAKNRLYEEIDMDWNEFEWYFKKFIEEKNLILVGSVGRWNGRVNGQCEVKNLRTISNMLQDCDEIRFYEEKNHFYIEGTHHDGTNYFELFDIAPKGYKRLPRYTEWLRAR